MSRRSKILVVEDQQENLDLMTYLLRAFGHETSVARNGAEALVLAAAVQPDLVIMDIQMPVMDGYEAVSAMRRDPALAGTRVVAMTAYAMVGDRDQILAAGFDAYLSKPIEPKSFVSDVEGLLIADKHDARAAGR
jgi:two-component system, cell cycle response regulator DivK